MNGRENIRRHGGSKATSKKGNSSKHQHQYEAEMPIIINLSIIREIFATGVAGAF
jgi:hypothetical protein